MCGITGFVSKEKNKKQIIKKMADRIAHRGPDDEGYYVDSHVALGHRRLSIIDLDSGKQPMFNEDEQLIVVFNGEIYNYIELRAELKKKKHTFATDSDTEVLLHGYEEWGIKGRKLYFVPEIILGLNLSIIIKRKIPFFLLQK